MNSIILYESKTGTTTKCANFIKENNNIEEISTVSKFKGDIKSYDNILIFTPVYVGQINKKVKQFIEQNESILLSKNIVICICSMNKEEYNQMVKNNFTDGIINHAEIVDAGGAYNFENTNFLFKFIIKKMTGITSSLEEIKYDNLKKIRI